MRSPHLRLHTLEVNVPQLAGFPHFETLLNRTPAGEQRLRKYKAGSVAWGGILIRQSRRD